jgi:glycosyltransferase involved in cell wall biosynthesis
VCLSGSGAEGFVVAALVPAYNEERHLGVVLENVMKYVDLVILCDDGSTDGTAEVAQSLGVVVVSHKVNRGYGAALSSLFAEASRLNVDVGVTLDADGQHRPVFIPSMVGELLVENLDAVIGSRFLEGEGSAPRIKRWGVKTLNVLLRLGVGLRLSDCQSGFRAYGRRALHGLELRESGMGVSTEILLECVRRGLKVGEVPVSVSGYDDVGLLDLLRHGWDVYSSTLRYMLFR